ncbi:MAG: hypothetical protein PQJ58_09100, partial [Spirochaetales bacterium]|nr:hypothetical protein [Spirochaetales bacterium]
MRLKDIRNILQNSIVTVLLMYLLVIVLILVFASSMLGGMDQNTIGEEPVQIILLVAIPLLILAALLYSFFFVWNKVKTRHSRYRFRLRLISFIFLIILLISLPQTILSVRFVDMVFSRWFGTDVGDALNSGLEIALEYYFDLNRELEDIGNSPYLALSATKVINSPEQVWREIKAQYPRLEGMQIVSSREIYVFGDPRLTYSREEITRLQPGLIPKRTVPEFSILGLVRDYQLAGEPYRIILYRTIPRKFDE